MSRAELPIPEAGVVVAMLRDSDFQLAPMPNTIFTRDSSCWSCRAVRVSLLIVSTMCTGMRMVRA